MTNFSELLAELQGRDPESSLVFMIGDREIGAGYHVTELRHSFSKGIDCGGNVDAWEETRLQLLDGRGATHMSVGKFSNILRKSLAQMPELAQAPLLAEFAIGNAGLKLMTVAAPTDHLGRVVLQLGESRAVCKPAQRNKKLGGQAEACCGPNKAASAAEPCCGPEVASGSTNACCG